MADAHLLQGRLDVVHPVAGESYKLLFFASRERHTHASLHDVVAVSSTGAFGLSGRLLCTSDRFYVVLFANRPDKNGILCQSCLAWGVILPSCNMCVGVCRLVDVKDQTQALLRIQCNGNIITEPRRVHNDSISCSSELALVSASIAHVRQVYSSLKHETNSYLCWVMTPKGKVPVLPFIASIPSILTSATVDFERGEDLLAHLFSLAAINTCIGSKKTWKECNDAERCEWLAEAVMLIPRAMIYQQDVVRVGGTAEDMGADQWVRLLSFPEPNLAGFDFGNAYSPHAYSALLDARFLDGDRTSIMRPAIVLEGTARIGGSWVLDHNADLKRESFNVHLKLLGRLRSEAGYARVLRSEASMAMAAENGVYGPIHAVIAGEHGRARDAVHLLAHEAGSSAISVTPKQLFAYSPVVQFKTALSYNPQSGAAGYGSMCNDLPRSVIPFVRESKVSRPLESAGRFHVDIHYETYIKRKGEIDRAAESAGSGMRITKQAVQITDQLKVMQIWFQ